MGEVSPIRANQLDQKDPATKKKRLQEAILDEKSPQTQQEGIPKRPLRKPQAQTMPQAL